MRLRRPADGRLGYTSGFYRLGQCGPSIGRPAGLLPEPLSSLSLSPQARGPAFFVASPEQQQVPTENIVHEAQSATAYDATAAKLQNLFAENYRKFETVRVAAE